MDFEWKSFTGFTTLEILAEIQNMMNETNCEPEQFTSRVIFMSMYNDNVCGNKNTKKCVLRLWQFMQKESQTDIGHSSDLDQKNTQKPSGEWDDVAEQMILNVSESGHPVFRGTSARERGTLKM